MNPKDIIKSLNLQPRPEGGWFSETWRGDEKPRAIGSSMELHIHEDGVTRIEILGADITSDQRPQRIIPKETWQKSVPIDGWVLVGCTVAPGFEFQGFKMADKGWAP
jgi:predicted cupin superfamily sugar epimerase